jgi:hypothetical protein
VVSYGGLPFEVPWATPRSEEVGCYRVAEPGGQCGKQVTMLESLAALPTRPPPARMYKTLRNLHIFHDVPINTLVEIEKIIFELRM